MEKPNSSGAMRQSMSKPFRGGGGGGLFLFLCLHVIVKKKMSNFTFLIHEMSDTKGL